MKSFNLKYILLPALVALGPVVNAQAAETSSTVSSETAMYILIALVFLVTLIVLGVSYNLYRIMQIIVNNEARKRAEEKGEVFVPQPSLWSKLMQSWTGAVPLEEEKTVELDHEYDGIRELDNHLPPWWLALFYGTVVFGGAYLFIYHVAKIWPLSAEAYEIEVAEAKAMMASQATFDETTIEYNQDPAFLAEGETVFQSTCATCHREDGGGLVGPNLTDDSWLHGGSVQDIFKVITNGVAGTAMTSWENSLTPKQRAQVTSFIYSLGGTNPPQPKAPEGQVYVRESAAADSTAVETPVDSTMVEVVDSVDANNDGGEQ